MLLSLGRVAEGMVRGEGLELEIRVSIYLYM